MNYVRPTFILPSPLLTSTLVTFEERVECVYIRKVKEEEEYKKRRLDLHKGLAGLKGSSPSRLIHPPVQLLKKETAGAFLSRGKSICKCI